jgi:hypothetical protein
MSYAVVWSEDGGPLFAGSLELESGAVRLDGRTDETPEPARQLPYGEIVGVGIEREPASRLGGRPTLVLTLRGGSLLRLASVVGAGSLRELADGVESARAEFAAAGGGRRSVLLHAAFGA